VEYDYELVHVVELYELVCNVDYDHEMVCDYTLVHDVVQHFVMEQYVAHDYTLARNEVYSYMDEINVEVAYVIESSNRVNADVDGTSVQKELEFDVASYEENVLNLYLELYFSSVKQAECSLLC
jgi:hypothetical protein